MTLTKFPGIVQLAKNHFEIRARATCPRTGRRKEVRREQRCSLKEARALQERWRVELEQSLRVDAAPRVRLRDFAPSWLRGRIERGELKPSSAQKLASVYDLHIVTHQIADLYIEDITPPDIERWIEDQRGKRYVPGKGRAANRKSALVRAYSASTIRGQYRALCTFVSAAAKKARVMNPCASVAAPTARARRKNFLRVEDLQKVLVFVKGDAPEWYAAVLLDAFTGLRWGELSALRWEDVDETKGVIRVVRGNYKGILSNSTKCGEEGEARVVPLLAAVAEALREHRRRMEAANHKGLAAGWIFPTRAGELHRGSPLGGDDGVLTRACAAVATERRITPHGLRHTANDLLRRVADGEVVRAIMGHSTEAMTHHYSHIDEGEKRAAAERVFEQVTGTKGVEKGVPGNVN